MVSKLTKEYSIRKTIWTIDDKKETAEIFSCSFVNTKKSPVNIWSVEILNWNSSIQNDRISWKADFGAGGISKIEPYGVNTLMKK